MQSLETLAVSIELPTNTTERIVVLAQNNFAMVVQDIDPATFSGEAFSADLGPIDKAVEDSGDIDEDKLVRMVDVIPNATASVELPESFFNASGNATERLFYTVFLSDTFFLTPNTTCPNGAIGSIIVTVQINGSANLTGNITLNFQRLSKVSCTQLLHYESTESKLFFIILLYALS